MWQKNGIYNIYKPTGSSPLEAIESLRLQEPSLKDTSITYAGRLDPMAEGVLILLAGEAVREKEKYLGLNKEYEAEILFGFETDTYDVLGLPAQLQGGALKLEISDTEKEINNLKGKISLPLPPYSSYRINGKPLFAWAREGKLGEIEIPTRSTEVFNISVSGSREIESGALLNEVENKISLIKGDFRQEQILDEWRKILSNDNKQYLAIKIKITCSSGTYIRSIAHKLGQDLKTGAILLNLKRTRVGEFDIKDSLKLATRSSLPFFKIKKIKEIFNYIVKSVIYKKNE